MRKIRAKAIRKEARRIALRDKFRQTYRWLKRKHNHPGWYS